jgi:hypothetical protein
LGWEAIKREASWRLLKMPFETVKLTASFKLDGLIPESLFSTYREVLGRLLDYAWAKGVTSFKRLKAEKYHELRAKTTITLHLHSVSDGLLDLQELQEAQEKG